MSPHQLPLFQFHSLCQVALLQSAHLFFIGYLRMCVSDPHITWIIRLDLTINTTGNLVMFSLSSVNTIFFIGFIIVFSSHFRRLFFGWGFPRAFGYSRLFLYPLNKISSVSGSDVKYLMRKQSTYRKTSLTFYDDSWCNRIWYRQNNRIAIYWLYIEKMILRIKSSCQYYE